MSDGPTHYVLIENGEGDELRRLGPMHLGRAGMVKARLENNPTRLGLGNTARIADNPGWDFENNREKENADTDETDRGEGDDRGRHHSYDPRNKE